MTQNSGVRVDVKWDDNTYLNVNLKYEERSDSIIAEVGAQEIYQLRGCC